MKIRLLVLSVSVLLCVIWLSAQEPTPMAGDPLTLEDYVVHLSADWEFDKPHLLSFKHVDGKIEVVYRQSYSFVYLYDQIQCKPDRIWKEIYVSDGNKIVLKEKVYGKIIPEQTTPERIEW